MVLKEIQCYDRTLKVDEHCCINSFLPSSEIYITLICVQIFLKNPYGRNNTFYIRIFFFCLFFVEFLFEYLFKSIYYISVT